MTQEICPIIPELTEEEMIILQEDPLNMIPFLQIKYSNNREVQLKLNKFIESTGLNKQKDSWGDNIVSTKPFYRTDNEYMIHAIENDNTVLFEGIFTHEVQRILFEPLQRRQYIFDTLNDCIDHDAISCIKHILNNDYTKNSILNWLVNISVSQYWFPSISRHIEVINTLFVNTGVIDKMQPLERLILGCMLTESALKMCNTKAFQWCITTFWHTIDYLSSQYAKEPYLNEKHLEIYRRLTEEIN